MYDCIMNTPFHLSPRDDKFVLMLLNGIAMDNLWSISSLCNDIMLFSKKFTNCLFKWVNRETNSMAHSLAKSATHDSVGFLCNNSSIPPLFRMFGLEICFLFLVIIHLN